MDFADSITLSSQEKSDLDDFQNIYSIIRTLDALESEYSRGRVEGKEYETYCVKLINQYSSTVDNLQNFPGLDYFVDKYNLKHCKNAITRLREKRSNYRGNLEELENSKRAFRFGQEIVELVDYIDLGEV